MSLLQHFAGASLVRRAADEGLRQYALHRTARLNRLDAAGVQRDTLLRLIRHAAATRFGREHGFERIRTIADYQARVPLRDYETFWNDYWGKVYPNLQGVTWPGTIPYFALSSGTTSGTTKYIPISREMLASNRKAALTTLALFRAANPAASLFNGRVFFLGGSTNLEAVEGGGWRVEGERWRVEGGGWREKRGTRNAERGMKNNASLPPSPSTLHPSPFPLHPSPSTLHSPPILAGDLSGIAAVEVPSLLRPYTFPPLDLALQSDWESKVQVLAEHSAKLPITVLSGVPSWLLVLFDRLKRVTGKDRIADIWPTLRLVIHGGTKFDPYRALFRREIGDDAVCLLETYPCSEGFVATEDPRHELLRLVPDHDIFFEFVPVEELAKDRPTRHTVADLEPGVQYAVVLTTCAGLWSYLVGDTVCFERRDPPLLRFTGRTRYFLSAFGEHLISEEIERAVAEAAEKTGSAATDFHVGPVFPERANAPGHHRYLIEFAQVPANFSRFATELDEALGRLNEDYRAHRHGSLSLGAPEVMPVPRGGFAQWMRSRGKLGGQHKVPRMDNSGRITAELSEWFAACGFASA